MNFVFFGSDNFSVKVLDTLLQAGEKPSLIITIPDRPLGRKLITTPSAVKVWAQKNQIDYIQPEMLKNIVLPEKAKLADFFLVASYGKIIPQNIIDLPRHCTLNIHPSLLPEYRGSSPIETAILKNNKVTGVSIIVLDAQVDHGPIIAQEKINLFDEENTPELSDNLAIMGTKLLLKILPDWLVGKIKPIEQEHQFATFTQKIKKEDGLIDLDGPALENYRRYRAFQPWPGIFALVGRREKKIRLNIKKAHLEADKFIIDQVIPEGKNIMTWQEFQRGQR